MLKTAKKNTQKTMNKWKASGGCKNIVRQGKRQNNCLRQR